MMGWTSPGFRRIRSAGMQVLRSIAAFLSADILWLLLLSIGGASLISVGVYLLYGLGFALISSGVFCLFFAFVIFRGMRNG